MLAIEVNPLPLGVYILHLMDVVLGLLQSFYILRFFNTHNFGCFAGSAMVSDVNSTVVNINLKLYSSFHTDRERWNADNEGASMLL